MTVGSHSIRMPRRSRLWNTCEMRSRSSPSEVSFSIIDASVTMPRTPSFALSASATSAGPTTDRKCSTSVRVIPLADSPSAFGSTHAAEADRDDDFWIDRAGRSSTGTEIATFLARVDRPVVGLVTAFRVEKTKTSFEIVSMWTAPHGRRSGAGRRLVGAVTEWAISGRASEIGLWVIRGNAGAQRFYESLGFTETGDFQPLPSDPCKDEVRMRLDLAAP